MLLAWPAAAQPLPGLGPGDARQPVTDPARPPWSSLGRVQTALGGRCTGALIAARTVLTAAHCLVSSRTRSFVRPESVFFLLGYQRGESVAVASVASIRRGAYDPVAGGPPDEDWALLYLTTSLAAPVLPLLTEVQPGAEAMLGGYQQDRPEVLLATLGCRILRGGPMLLHDCASTRGASGAPLLARRADGTWGIAGVATRMARDRALGEAVAVARLPR